MSSNFISVLTTPCLVDGGWSVWGSWTSCSKTCGTGTGSRNRQCDNPAPAHGGEDCQGSDNESGDCYINSCPGRTKP